MGQIGKQNFGLVLQENKSNKSRESSRSKKLSLEQELNSSQESLKLDAIKL